MKTLIKAAIVAVAVGFAVASAQAQDVVRIGTEGAYPPFNSIDENGNLVGFDIDIANALCDAAGYTCEFVVQDWDGIIPGLLAKKYDAIIASMSITEERKEQVDFTNKYYNTPAKFIKPNGMDLQIPDDVAQANQALAGMKVGVQRATIHENFIRDNFPDVEVVVYATQDEANLDLANGRVDLVMADSVALDEGFLKTDQGAEFEFVGPDYNDPRWHGEGAGIAVRKGEPELLAGLNAALEQILADGTYKAINDTYFDFDVYGSQ
jgi:lysine-arginine-ornithine-binding protein